jgi:hypothetical protein
MAVHPNASMSRPLLLGGENRSGTTLLSVLLDSHPDAVVGPELDFLEPVDIGPHVVEACELLLAGDERVLGPGTDTRDPYWYDGAHFVKQCQRFGILPSTLREITVQVMKETRSDLSSFDDRCYLIETVGQLRAARNGVDRWGIKLQRKIKYVEQFAEYWPEARFVHIIRDGRDVAASHIVTVPWGNKTIERAAAGWLEVVAEPHRVATVDRYLEVRYEDLVTDLPASLKMILEFVDLPWDDSLLRHNEIHHSISDHPWDHPSANAATTPVAVNGQIGRYRADLTPAQIEQYERLAGNELLRNGYALT